MKTRTVQAALGVFTALSTAVASAEHVEFRVVTRPAGGAGQAGNGSDVTNTQNVVSFSVQARVVGNSGAGIAGFGFDLYIPGEQDSYGTLARIRTSNADGTYSANTANSPNQTVGQGGLAGQFSSLALQDPLANGTLNTSAGTFVNDPNLQEIALTTGYTSGLPLVRVTDTNADGTPDTTNGQLASDVSNLYFGSNGNWIDVYRFRYTVTFFSSRYMYNPLLPSLQNVRASTFTRIDNTSGQWEPSDATPATIVPTPTISALMFTAGAFAFRRNRR